MFNLSSIIPSTSENSSEKITKSIKRGLIGAEAPTYEGEKIKKRTTTILSHLKKEDEWKADFERREKQKCKGVFSHKLHAYQELGETELDTKKLILDAMENIGTVFDMENVYDTAYKKSNKEQESDKDNSQKKRAKSKMKYARKASLYKRPERIESGDSGFTTIQELLDKADKRITFLKAGRPLIHCIDVESQLMRENRYKEKTAKLEEMLKAPEMPKKDEEADIMICQYADARTRKRFLAKLESLKNLFCCVINMKNRDLNNMAPLSKEMLESIRKGVTQECTQLGNVPLGPRSSAIPELIIAANRTHRLHRLSVSNDYESEYVPSSVLFKLPSGDTSYADMDSAVSKFRLNREASRVHFGGTHSSVSKCRLNREATGKNFAGMQSPVSKCLLNREASVVPSIGIQLPVSKCRLNNTEASGKPSVGFTHTEKNWPSKSGSRSSHLQPVAVSTQIESWHDLMAHQPNEAKLEVKPVKGMNMNKALKQRRGAIFQGKGDLDLPIWQKIIHEKVKRKDIRFGRPQEVTKKKKKEGVEYMLEKKRSAFEKMKSKNVYKLQKDLDARIDCFKQRLEYLKISMFQEEDIKNMRQKVKDFQKQSNLDSDCPAGWYEALCEKQQSLSLEDDEDVTAKLKELLQFTRIEITYIPHLRAKLCLLVMSLPIFEICHEAVQEALKFFMVTVMDISEIYLEDWMLHRKLWVNNGLLE